MGNIVLLDELTINQIAAGEVIERPASVIKEMVENSIDAGATNITVEIKNGGISFIKITDNGKGIAEDDIEIAFERHATSKIRKAEDLNQVTSMGFRGEALASIAAVANVELISKTDEQVFGIKVNVEAGNILGREELACPTGTSITVRNLFFNTPVRYKFLKKDFTETGYIEDVITRIALVNPQIAIKLINSGKVIIQTSGNGDLKSVIYSIYGRDIANAVEPVNYIYEDIRIIGVVGKPEIARSNRSNQLFFVNKRYIKDKILTMATEQAYKGLIPIGKYGFLILNLEVSPSKVDVNVHPAKLEVRFEEENKIFQAVYHTIKDTLLKTELVANSEVQEDEEEYEVKDENEVYQKLEKLKKISKGLFDFRKNNEKIIEKYNDEESKIKTNNIEENQNVQKALNEDMLAETMKNAELQEETVQDGVVQQEVPQEEVAQNEIMQNALMQEETAQNEEIQNEILEENFQGKSDEVAENNEQINVENTDDEEPKDFDIMYEKLFGKRPIIVDLGEEKRNNEIDLIKDNISLFENNDELKKLSYKFVGIVFNTYIILEIDKEMYILDQHAAHERIMYEKVKKNYYSETDKDSQMLLLPDIITLSHKEMEIAKDNMDMFERAGFCLEEFGENTIKLTGIPTICLEIDNKDLFLDTLDEINTVARTAKQEREEKFIATVACKAAVKANMALEKEEVDKLMDKLLELPNPFTCPHGRPTVIKMTKYDIERKFARK